MSRRIRVLDRSTVNKIAAGEVVESPFSVLKELMENSLDAGAKSINIEVDEGGLRRIKVSDDGSGMSREDVQVAFTRHSTSKIGDIDDLEKLSTLGFRGEALASIAAVSQVELVTREPGSEAGTRAVVSAGNMLELEEVGCPQGTSITVTGLFENVPARKKFLRSISAEKARCIDVVSRAMMVHPEVGFKLATDGQERLSGPSTDDLRERVAAVLGPKTARSMIWMEPGPDGPVQIQGLLSLPWETRSNTAGMTLSVNGRVVKNRAVIEAVRSGYGSRLMKGRFPLAVLFIDIEGKQIDVNVHPTKDLIKFSNEGALLNLVGSKVSSALFTSYRKKKREEMAGEHARAPPVRSGSGPVIRVNRKPVQVPLMEGEVRPQETGDDPWREVPAVEGMNRLPPALPEDIEDLRVRIIGQLDRSYILCEIGSDLLLVDQHAAHERIRLEYLKKRSNEGGGGIQELLDPIHIELDPAAIERLASMEKNLDEIGFRTEGFGDNCIVLRALPEFMGKMEAHTVLTDLLTGNESHEGCSPPDQEFTPMDLPIRERVLALTACRGAIKAHQNLSLKEMEDLISDLLKCEVPLHCAHGRPTMIRLPLSVLERWFKRVL
ncbi:MAG: DNA mismatch repair endonuclease MutL [Candidatus Thermoplasmatota archaeon]|nr:DNA mismatch repair endonuclease MutL [Candidatus Thermoplasmatota archaeon]